jgi:ubiquitin carboxyl-terminal hydrolase 1
MYELRAVITHYGRHENGHYVCYRRHAWRKGPEGGLEEKPAKLAGEKAEVDEVDGIAGLEGEDARKEDAVVQVQEEEMDESQWWRLSDQDVTKVDEETVLAQSGVFMLFYDCVDPNSTLASEVEHFVDSVSLQEAGGSQNDASGEAEPTGPSETPTTGVQQDRSGPAPSGEGAEDSREETTEAQSAAQEEKPRPLTRAEKIARAKVLFAGTAERAATVPLPDEDEDL